MRKQRNKRSKFVSNKSIKGIIISLSTLLIIYLGISIYFTNHFYFGSVLNGVNVSGKTVSEAEELMAFKIETYSLQLNERGDKQELINAADVGLKYNSDGKIQGIKDNQNPFAWILAPFNKQDTEISGIILYDNNMLNESLEKLDCFNSKDVVEPKNASLKYTSSGYEIVNEVFGNKVNKNSLHDTIVDAILNGKTEADLDSSNCYENPKYLASSQEVLDAKNIADKFTASQITYTFGDNTEVLDGSTIHNWIEIDENFGVIFNESKVKSYIYTLASKYNTFGKTREFTATSGAKVKVPGGDYGWLINSSAEVQDLIKEMQDGQTLTKEPKYSQTAVSHSPNDIGNTYVEIDLTKQHLWFYKNGSLVVEGDVVTGGVSSNTVTPAGTYKLKYKEKDATLVGEDYSSPVSFWMPFNGGIGIHDATWRTEFGGAIYQTNGSHGCVNAPLALANTIFDNIEAGTPVVCY